MIRLITLWLQLRAKQAHLDGIDAALECIDHPGLKNRYIERRMALKRDLHRITGDYKLVARERNPWRTV